MFNLVKMVRNLNAMNCQTDKAMNCVVDAANAILKMKSVLFI